MDIYNSDDILWPFVLRMQLELIRLRLLADIILFDCAFLMDINNLNVM